MTLLSSSNISLVLTNLLTNSGFGVWSNSGDLYTTAGTVPAINDAYTHDTETCNDDAGDDESADWSETGGGAIAYVANTHYTFTGSGANEYVHSAADFAALTAGKLYELSITFADAAAAQTIQIGTFTTGGGATGFTALGSDITTTGSEVAHVRCFEAVGTETRIGFKVTSDCSGANFVLFTDSMLHEVTPGCIAANALGPDGWNKTGDVNTKLYRQHLDATLTKDGSFYSLKVVTSAPDKEVYWPKTPTESTHLAKFAGRTVTIGAWVYVSSATAISVKPFIYDSVTGQTLGPTFVPATTWKWVELTAIIDADSTSTYFGFDIVTSGTTVYFSQPMLVFGSSIGEVNYSPIPIEIINCEIPISLTDYNGTAKTTAADVVINLEAQSNGKLPKGLKTVHVMMGAGDSGSAGSAAEFGLGENVSVRQEVYINIGNTGLTLGNDIIFYSNSRVSCNSTGDIEAEIVATGSLTLDAYVHIFAIELR